MSTIVYFIAAFYCSQTWSQSAFSQANNKVNFIENRGQVHDQSGNPRPDVLYSGQSGPLVYHLFSQGVNYQLNKILSWKKDIQSTNISKLHADSIPNKEIVQRIEIKWVGSNKQADIIPELSQGGVSHYYGSSEVHNVKTYNSIWYKKIYEGIDLHYYSKDDVLKYDFVVEPFGDYKQIKLQVSGATVSLLKDGSALITTPLGKITEGKPVIYQEGKHLNASWLLKDNVLSFVIPEYDHSKELLIDPPTRAWSTYFGTSSQEALADVCTDAQGDVYVCGSGNPATTLATTGAFQTNYTGYMTGILAKFDSSGNRIWTTFYGSGQVNFLRITAYKNTVFVLGGADSTSTNVATPGVHRTTFTGGPSDLLLVKFSNSGTRQWGTYYGGPSGDWPRGLAADTSGNIYVAGLNVWYSGVVPPSTLLATPGAFQNSGNGGYVAKFSPSGARLWATMYGDNLGSWTIACATDKENNFIMVGSTGTYASGPSTVVLSTSGAFQAQRSSDEPEVHIVKFDPSGNRLWATYAGSYGTEIIYDVAVDSVGNIFLAGATSSSAGIATSGAFQTSIGGYAGSLNGISAEGWLTKYDKSGQRVWSTYYGGTADEEFHDCALDENANIYLLGTTTSTSSSVFASANAYQQSYGGGAADHFLAMFDSTGQRQWGTFYGGSGKEDQFYLGMSYGANGLYVAGTTTNQTIFGTSGAFQSSYGGGSSDGYLSKFVTCGNASVSAVGFPTQICKPETFTVIPSGATSYTIVPGNYTNMPAVITASASTIFTLTGETSGCTGIDSETFTISNVASPVSASGGLICSGNSFTILPSGAVTYTYSSGSAIVSPSSTSTYSVWGTNQSGCVSDATVLTITVTPAPVLSVTSSSAIICAGATVTLTAIGAQNYSWNNGPAQAVYIVSPNVTTMFVVHGDVDGCTSNTYFIQNVIDCSSVGLLEYTNGASIYPVPNNGSFTVMWTEEGRSELKLYSEDGRVIYKTQLVPGTNQIRDTNLAKGIYVCLFEIDGVTKYHAKLLVQ